MSDQKPASVPQRILVADDEHLMATGLTTALRVLDFIVVGPVSNGHAAIETAQQEAVDMALLDIRMPGVDGIAAARALWQDYAIPSVIISAYSDDSYLQQAQDTGVYGYLLKPASTENLRVTITIAWARAIDHGLQARRITQLESSLTHRRLIEEAKWKLVKSLGIDEPDAHARLQKLARNHRRRLIDVATDILEGRQAPS